MKFVLGDTKYQNSPFAKIPNHDQRSSWFLLTGGTLGDIIVIVDERTTVKQIWRGRYTRLVEISKKVLPYEHEFASSCKETSYTFNVRVKAGVSVNNPVDFYYYQRDNDIRTFLNNQISLAVTRIMRGYSITEYSGIDDALTTALTSSRVVDQTTGLSYQIQSVITEPNDDAKALLKKKDDMHIRAEMAQTASAIAQQSQEKSFEDAVREEVVQGYMTDMDAIRIIEDYQRKGYQERIDLLLKLRDEGFISDADMTTQVMTLLPTSNTLPKALPNNEGDVSSDADAYYDD
jgi:hypothetical protein